jgi:uncharacterized ion transporter superfamily protein YfcC
MMDEQIEQEQETGQVKERKYGIPFNPKIYPVAFVIFLTFIIGMGILTRILPQGTYDREIIDGTEYVVNGTYHILEEQNPMPVLRWFTAPFELLVTDTGRMVIILTASMMVISGIYAILDRSGLLKRLLSFVVRRFSKTKYLMLVIITVVFILLGSITGIIENFLLLIPLLVALSLAMKWDSFVGIAMVYIGTTRGFAASTLNPYTVGLVQIMADVPLYSGMWLRLVILGVTTVAFLAWLLNYARSVERDPTCSLMYKEDLERRDAYSYDELIHIEKRKYPLKEIFTDYGKGALTFLPMLPIGAMIMSLSYILTEGMVIDTVIYRMAQAIEGSSPTLAALQMLMTTFVVEIFIPGSVLKAYALMPVFIPLGDIVGLSRQVVCQVYILGDSFSNMLYPTDMVLMAVLGMVGSNYFKWLRWCGPFLLAMIALSIVFIIFAIYVGYV